MLPWRQSCEKLPEFEAVGAATLAAVGAERLESDGVITRVEFMRALESIRVAILPPHVPYPVCSVCGYVWLGWGE